MYWASIIFFRPNVSLIMHKWRLWSFRRQALSQFPFVCNMGRAFVSTVSEWWALQERAATPQSAGCQTLCISFHKINWLCRYKQGPMCEPTELLCPHTGLWRKSFFFWDVGKYSRYSESCCSHMLLPCTEPFENECAGLKKSCNSSLLEWKRVQTHLSRIKKKC